MLFDWFRKAALQVHKARRSFSETLESRWLMAATPTGITVDTSDHLNAVVMGTNRSETINVKADYTSGGVCLNVNGRRYKASANIMSVIVIGKGGDDQIKVETSKGFLGAEITTLIFGDDPDNEATKGDDTILAYFAGEGGAYGGPGNDFITGAGQPIFADGRIIDLEGGDGDDDIVGTGQSDTLVGGRGRDEIWGGNGDDVIVGDSGDDYLSGGAGSDYLDGGDGSDLLQGGRGDDFILGGAGDDYVSRFGTQNEIGIDYVDGEDGFDTLFYTDRKDEVFYTGDPNIEYLQFVELWNK
jgi:Ca2+-binding RTX toxin-like protein